MIINLREKYQYDRNKKATKALKSMVATFALQIIITQL